MPRVEQLLGQPEPQAHFLQLYKADARALTTNVSLYLLEGLNRAEGLLVIATPEHTESFTRQLKRLGAHPQSAIDEGRLVFFDAEQTLSQFMVNGQPEWPLFESTITRAIHRIEPGTGNGLRAYGDMVGVLWAAGQTSAAIRLEEFWNKLLASIGFKLFCGYPIDIFDEEFQSSAVKELLCAHTHLVPCGQNGDLDLAMSRAVEEVVGPSLTKRTSLRNGNGGASLAAMSHAEARILSLKHTYAERAGEILPRARQYYQTEKRFRALVENSSDAISLMDARGKILYASASSAKVLGYAPEELTGRRAFDLIHPDDLGQAVGGFQQALAAPCSPVQLEMRARRADGRWCWIETTTSNLLYEPDVRAVVSNYRDISERKAAEEEKQRNSEKLARSNAELQAFAYAATHDLKEPLRTIGVFTQLLAQRIPLDDKSQELAGFIVDGVKRMSSLLDDLLSLTSLRFGDPPHAVELRHAVDQALRNLGQAVRESGARVDIGPLPAAHGNESHFLELFQNLISNAIKYRSDAPVEIGIRAEQFGSEWLVKVTDNGIGIAPEYHEQIFGLFKRLHPREVPGTGIGLAICKKIVDGIGGKIWVESSLGRGSTFCFTVPAVSDCAGDSGTRDSDEAIAAR